MLCTRPLPPGRSNDRAFSRSPGQSADPEAGGIRRAQPGAERGIFQHPEFPRQHKQQQHDQHDHDTLDVEYDERAFGPAAGEAAGAPQDSLAESGPRRAADGDVGAGAQPVQVRLDQRGRLPVHGVREGRRAEDVQEQVQLPATRVLVPRGAPAEGLPVPRLPEGVLAAGQDEEPHEDGPRLLHAEGLCVPDGVFSPAVGRGMARDRADGTD